MNAKSKTRRIAGFVGCLFAVASLPADAGATNGTESAAKSLSLGHSTALTLSAEARLRFDSLKNAQQNKTYEQGLFRGVVGADARWNRHIRAFAEFGTAQVRGHKGAASANFQNALSLQQALVEASSSYGGLNVSAMVGRQEFADGPRQLISLSDGPNLHRSWNGARLYVESEHIRLGTFTLRATRLARGALDEGINSGETLNGMNARLAISKKSDSNAYVEPFWFATSNSNVRLGSRSGRDERDTVGVRFSGRNRNTRYDWTVAYQTGKSLERPVNAWGLFMVQDYRLRADGWNPRLTARIDLASGGGTDGTGTMKAFNQLYASSSYLGEGQFLSLSNLLMVTPGLALAPTSQTTLSMEYGLARRLKESDPVYGGAMRPYPGTERVPGRAAAGLARVSGTWSVSKQLTYFMNYEHMHAGAVLRRAGRDSGRYVYAGATYRY